MTYTGKKRLLVTAVYGGVSFNPQVQQLSRADVVVATPGRLLDHLNQKTIDLSQVNILVLDEADRMLDMGFIDDVEKIMRSCPKNRQTLFFSATISGRIEDLTNKYMNNPVRITATKEVDPSKLTQEYYDVPSNMKFSLLVHLLKEEKEGLVMIFCNTRRVTDSVTKNLKENKIRALAIHGGLTQSRRMNMLEQFNDGKVAVLVCTDVAARGLHIDNVSHVYNYDLPIDPKEYVHRIGRTARAGESGKVINLVSDRDHDSFSRILREFRFDIKNVEKPYIERVVMKRDEGGHDDRQGGFSRGRMGGQRSNGMRGRSDFGPRRSSYSGNRSGGQGERHSSGANRSEGGARRSFGANRSGERRPSSGASRSGGQHRSYSGPRRN